MADELHRPSPSRRRRADLRPTTLGALVHAAVVVLLATLDRSPRHRDIDAVVMRLLPSDLAPVYRQTVLIRVATAVARYFALFDRRPAWEPLGVELHVADVRLDVVWRRGQAIEADELKSGLSAATSRRPLALAQARAELGAGREVFGAAFSGVRMVVLVDPAASLFVRSDGRVEPISLTTLRRPA